jgi:hypothetical protein
VGCIVNISDIPAAYIFSIEECANWGETLDMGIGQQGLELWVIQWRHVALISVKLFFSVRKRGRSVRLMEVL